MKFSLHVITRGSFHGIKSNYINNKRKYLYIRNVYTTLLSKCYYKYCPMSNYSIDLWVAIIAAIGFSMLEQCMKAKYQHSWYTVTNLYFLSLAT